MLLLLLTDNKSVRFAHECIHVFAPQSLSNAHLNPFLHPPSCHFKNVSSMCKHVIIDIHSFTVTVTLVRFITRHTTFQPIHFIFNTKSSQATCLFIHKHSFIFFSILHMKHKQTLCLFFDKQSAISFAIRQNGQLPYTYSVEKQDHC